jgi:phosphinothricin acetyltransferase
MPYRLEPMTPDHRVPVIAIYNYYVAHGVAAYPEATVDPSFFDRFLDSTRGYPAIVARDEAGAVVGFAFLQAYNPLSTFRGAAVITYFIHPEHTGRGLGASMLDRLAAEGRRLGIRTLLAHIASLNEGSVRFHRRHGFREVGRFADIGRKRGRTFDVVWMQKEIGLDAPDPRPAP